jgi:hypothetical protein
MIAGMELPSYVEPPCWRVSPPDLADFLRHLPAFIPPDAVFCLEAGPAPEIEAYLRERPAAYENETDQGFLKMRPKVFYTPATGENLHGLAALSERYAEPEVCNSLRVYYAGRIILSWDDLPDDPVYIAGEVGEAAVRRFCEMLGSEYAARATFSEGTSRQPRFRKLTPVHHWCPL